MIFELPSKDVNITPEKARQWQQLQLRDKTAYVRGLRYKSMRSFATEEAPSPLPPLYSTLVLPSTDQVQPSTNQCCPLMIPVPPSTIQFCLILTQYVKVPKSTTLYCPVTPTTNRYLKEYRLADLCSLI